MNHGIRIGIYEVMTTLKITCLALCGYGVSLSSSSFLALVVSVKPYFLICYYYVWYMKEDILLLCLSNYPNSHKLNDTSSRLTQRRLTKNGNFERNTGEK
jgi:hypothetical protein